MAIPFTNQATISLNGTVSTSNITSGELIEPLTITKTALQNTYQQGSVITYIVNLVNSGSLPVTVTDFTDNLGGYSFGTQTLYPLSYIATSLNYYLNGVLQPSPTVTVGPPLNISSLTIPANGIATLIYQATVNTFAPLGTSAAITNTVTATPDNAAPLSATATINQAPVAVLGITKSMSPTSVQSGSQLTYTFVIQNTGNTAVTTGDTLTFTDTFDPILSNITVTYNGTTWTENTNYTYDASNGIFKVPAGEITVPPAQYTQDTNGNYLITPGSATITVTGTVNS